MPKLEIEGVGQFEVAAGTRLVNAMREHVDIGHRCGGFAGCTTCRVEFFEGEPERMTQAEVDKLKKVDALGQVRLSCQVLVEDDMKVKPLLRTSEQGWPDSGPEPAESIEPDPAWTSRDDALS